MLGSRDPRSDAGATLVEMLVALVILSVAGVAILAGLQLSIKASDIHRKSATSGANVRNYAEAIERYVEQAVDKYESCAADGAYAAPTVGFTPDPGLDLKITQTDTYRLDETKIGTSADPWEPCPSAGAPDRGVQRLKLTVEDLSDGRGTETLFLILRRPCDRASLCAD